MLRSLFTAVALFFALPQPALAFDIENMTTAERAAFQLEVRRYLLENPQVIMDAVAVLEEQQRQQAQAAATSMIASNADEIFNDEHSWVGGNPSGDVVVVEFLDYRCGFCRRAHPEVEELVASDGNIRIIVKEFPVLGEASVTSSRLAIAVKELAGDEAYKVVHDALITLTSDVSPLVITRLSNQLGLDPDDVMAKMESREVSDIIRKNRALAQSLGINGTPTFILGDVLQRGYAPLEQMRETVEAVRASNG